MKKRYNKGYQIGTTISYLAYSGKLFIKAIMGPKILGLQPQSPMGSAAHVLYKRYKLNVASNIVYRDHVFSLPSLSLALI